MRSVVLILLAACGSDSIADPKPGSCEAVAKSLGKKLDAWKPPADCKVKGGGMREEYLVDNEKDARDHLECKDPKAKLGIDFAKHQLVATSRSMSPAQVGLEAYDDGKKITFVNKDRAPCKGDPQPHPGPNTTLLFQAATGKRTFGQASCTVERKCP